MLWSGIESEDDFAELSRLLARAGRSTEPDGTRPPVDRIVLYIDDLDRCPEDKVVDVLQAVHLLLAFPLFIVVVGVDSRWLLHSLQRHLKQFSAVENDDDQLSRALWESTPLNYLEKIFQIPFTIRPMRSGAFGDLIENLTLPQNEVVRTTPSGHTTEIKAPAPTPTTAQTANTPSTSSGGATPPAAQSPTTLATPQAPAPPPVDFLALQKWEREAMKAMYPLIPSPRAAKRFVNTYRLMRGMIDEYDRPAFVGDEKNGEYPAALLMLAMLTGYPEETADVLRELVMSAVPPIDWSSFIDPLLLTRIQDAGEDEAKAARWRGLQERLAKIGKKLPIMPATASFVKWAPAVARFSFHSGRMVTAQAEA